MDNLRQKPSIVKKMQNVVYLENLDLRIGFNKENGSVTSIFNKRIDVEAIGYRDGAQLFRIVYPVFDSVSDVRSHAFDNRKQRLSDHKLIEEKEGKKLVLQYDRMVSELGSFDIKVFVECSIPNRGQDCFFSMKIVNMDEGEVSQVYFPLLSGIKEIGEKREDVLLIPTAQGPIKNPLKMLPGKRQPLGFNEERTVIKGVYPGNAQMQWMDYYCDTHGLFMTCLNKEGEFVVLFVKKNVWDPEEHLSMAMIKYPYIQRGAVWSSSRFMISLHEGDWHSGADRYREWLNTWLERPELPGWLRYTNGFLHAIGRQGDGTTVNKIEELPDIFQEAKAHGLDIIFYCGWYKEGHDGRYPDYAPIDEKLQKQMLKRIHENGGRILLYLQGTFASTSNPAWEEELSKWVVKSVEGKRGPVETADGRRLLVRNRGATPAFLAASCESGSVAHWEWSPGHFPSFEGSNMAFMCPSCKDWRAKLVEGVRTIAETGGDIVFLDSLSIVSPPLCFDEDHEHTSPDRAWGPGALKLMKEVLELRKKLRQEFYISSEGICDVYSPYVGLYHSRIGSNPEVFRYTLPWVTGISGNFIDMGGFGQLYQSFLLGLALDVEIYSHARGRFSLDPELAGEIRRLNALRTSHKDLFVDGTFKDDIGITSDNEDTCVRAFTKEDGILLTFWHRGSERSKATITVDLQKLGVELKRRRVRIPEKGVEAEFAPEKVTIKLLHLEPNSVDICRIE